MSTSASGANSNRGSLPPDSVLFGQTQAMATVREALRKIADTNIPVLIEGESGTGKELVCRYLHEHSVWGRGPLVRINCPAVPSTFLDGDFFTSAQDGLRPNFSAKTGDVSLLRSGTLFFDEISELDLPSQSKLLQFLQDGRFHARSVSTAQKVHARVVCATNRRLQEQINKGLFRQDLYFRISGLVLQLPRLRERLQDLPSLAQYFVELYNEQFQRNMPPVSQALLVLMKNHSWTGNVRELENLIKRYVVLGTEDAIISELGHRELVPAGRRQNVDSAVSLGDLTRAAVQEMEGRIILDALRANQWNRRRTASSLKISYRSLLYKLKKVGISSRSSLGALRTGEHSFRNVQ
ncbi:MAG TPA: sigma 54-interacting transcriptional regulator [Terriglobales bacterium]